MDRKVMDRKLVMERSREFAGDVMKICSELEHKKQMVLSSQLLRAGTAIGALVAEAQQAETRLDFIHKMKMACKEVEETIYWLSLVSNVVVVNLTTMENLNAIKLILCKIVSTAKKNHKQEKGVRK